MAQIFANLPAPAANGSGTAVDTSMMGAVKTITVRGNDGVFEPMVLIEISNDAAATSWSPLTQFVIPGERTVTVVARWMRATVLNYKGGGAPTVDVGAETTTADYATLVGPAGNGAGAGVDVSALGMVKTIQMVGPFRGAVNVEVSEDGGTTWSQAVTFFQPGIKTVTLAADYMRVTRNGVPENNPGTVTAYLGAVDIAGVTDGGVAISANASSVSSGTVVFSNSNGVSFGLSGSTVTASVAAAPAAGIQSISGGTTLATGPAVVFSNSNNVSFGINGNTVTATASLDGGIMLSAGTESISNGVAVLSNSHNVSFGLSGSTVTASASYSQSAQPAIQSISAGTTRATTGEVVLSNANNVSFGMNAGTVTASATFAQTTQPAVNLAAGTETATSGTVVFSNSNGISFGMSGSSRITASYTQSTAPAAISANGAAAASGTIIFSNSNNVSFGMNGNTITASASSPAETPFAISAGTQSVSTGTLVFSNSNGVSFGMSGSSRITASIAGVTQTYLEPMPLTNQGIQALSSVYSLYPIVIPHHMRITRCDLLLSLPSASSYARYTNDVRLYSMSGSTIASVLQINQNDAWVSSQSSQYTGLRWYAMTMATVGSSLITPGQYMVGVNIGFFNGNATDPVSHYGAMIPPVITKGPVDTNYAALGPVFGPGLVAGSIGDDDTFEVSQITQTATYAIAQPYVRFFGS